jgi:type II secretory pathway pseudopilin PulG
MAGKMKKKDICKKGFSLIEVIFGINIWLIVFMLASGIMQNIFRQQEKNERALRELMQVQQQLRYLKNLEWDNVVADKGAGVYIEVISPTLKRAFVKYGSICLETVVCKEP